MSFAVTLRLIYMEVQNMKPCHGTVSSAVGRARTQRAAPVMHSVADEMHVEALAGDVSFGAATVISVALASLFPSNFHP